MCSGRVTRAVCSAVRGIAAWVRSRHWMCRYVNYGHPLPDAAGADCCISRASFLDDFTGYRDEFGRAQPLRYASMFTGVFRERTRSRPGAAQDALASVLQSRSLRPHRFVRHCEIGPFLVEYVCRERSLVVELQPRLSNEPRQARTAFLNEMGYSVLCLSRAELLTRPDKVLSQIRAALL